MHISLYYLLMVKQERAVGDMSKRYMAVILYSVADFNYYIEHMIKDKRRLFVDDDDEDEVKYAYIENEEEFWEIFYVSENPRDYRFLWESVYDIITYDIKFERNKDFLESVTISSTYPPMTFNSDNWIR